MDILIYGAGSVGLALGSTLIKSGQSVDFIGRRETVLALRKKGLIRNGIFGRFKANPSQFFCYTSLGELPKKSYDFILVTTKSFDSLFATEDLFRYPFLFNQKTKIILCQNGWGNAEIFRQFFPAKRIYNARVITGFYRPQPNTVTITVHADRVLMGSLYHQGLTRIRSLCTAINQGDIPCKVSRNIEKDLWAKMLYNCALNPLGAILSVPYGVLGKYDSTREVINKIIHEVFLVMKKASFKTHWQSAEEYLKAFYKKFLPSTAQHESSMLQDLKAKKKTEIDALNGIIVQLAQQFKLNVPVNRTLYQMIKSIEKSNLSKKG